MRKLDIMKRRTFINGSIGAYASASLPIFSTPIGNTDERVEMRLDTGLVTIKLLSSIAPNHVNRIKFLADAQFYDGLPFHRVIDGFMAQTGDPGSRLGAEFGELPKLEAELSDIAFERGTVGMARSNSVHSACHQFFITFSEANFLNRRYTAFGKVIGGMDAIAKLRVGDPYTGTVASPEFVRSIRIASDV